MPSMGFLFRMKRWGVLAMVLAALVFVMGGRAEAAEHDHGAAAHHAVQTDHAGHHAAVEEHADAHDQDGGLHHDGGCHCMSAACASALAVFLPEYAFYLPRSRHTLPAAMAAFALAGVDPPAKPPRT